MEFIRRKIKIPKSLGETLKNARKKKDLTLEQAEEETKVRIKYLSALEDGRYEILPSSVYAVGFLAKYADFLGLNKDRLIEQFSIERGKIYDHAKIMVERRIREPLFSITPKFILIASIVIALCSVLGYIIYSVHQFTSPPNLAISSPSADQVIREENVHIIGKTDEGVTLMINGENVSMDDKGNFNQIVKLHSGLNSFEVRSINGLKKESVKLIKVLAEIPGLEMPVTPDQSVVDASGATDTKTSSSTGSVIKIDPKVAVPVKTTTTSKVKK
ncbi:MAG: helix-turn-helix domain-containing protein [Candidatus Berkelbacteria bacterium]